MSFDNKSFEFDQSKIDNSFHCHDLEKEDKDTDSLKLIKSFCKHTSGHGFVRIVESTKIVRWIWVLIMILTFIGLIIHFILLIFRYFDYGVNSSFYVTPDNQLVMPDITICPNQRFYFVESNEDFNLSLTPDTTEIYNGTTFRELFNRYTNIWNIVIGNISSITYARYSIMRQAYYAKRLRGKYDVIIKVSFKRNEISFDNLFATPTFDGFICVTFKPASRILNSLSGPDDTVMIINMFEVGGMDRFENEMRSTEEKINPGSTLYLHSPNSMPDLKNSGHLVYRSLTKQMSFDQSTIIRDNSNNVCFYNPDNIKVKGYGINENYSYSYSQSLCIETKKSETIHKVCGCRSEILIASSAIPDSISFCHEIPSLWSTKINGLFKTIDNTQMDAQIISKLKENYLCHKNQINLLENEKFSSICLPMCVESSYRHEVSSAKLERQLVGFKTIYNQSIYEIIPYIQIENKSIDVLKAAAKNELENDFRFTVVKFVPKQLTVEVTEESLSYPIENLLSDIGGILGLYLGFSVMSMLEIAELMVQLFIQNFFISKEKKT